MQNRASKGREIKGGVEDPQRFGKMKDFCFGVFYNKAKLL